MATSEEYFTFVCEQIARFGAVRYRKMFGDATVYLARVRQYGFCQVPAGNGGAAL